MVDVPAKAQKLCSEDSAGLTESLGKRISTKTPLGEVKTKVEVSSYGGEKPYSSGRVSKYHFYTIESSESWSLS